MTGLGVDSSKIVGSHQCIDCHRAEFHRWSKSYHGGKGFDALRGSPKSSHYAEAVGVEFTKVTQEGLCIKCHATVQEVAGQTRVLPNVSCETCHNPSGGDDGWLNGHAVYGPNGTRRADETADHFKSRRDRCDEAHQLRSDKTYDLIKRCAACHIPSHEELYEAGHDHSAGSYEFVTKALGEVRHNFTLDQSDNAEVSSIWLSPREGGEKRTAAGRKRLMYVVGYLVDLEVSLANLSTTTDVETDFAVDLADRIVDGFEDGPEEFLDSLDETELPMMEEIFDLIEPIYEKIDDDGVEEFSDEDLAHCLEVSKSLATLTRQFAEKHADEDSLREIEEPERPEDYE